MKLHVVVGEQIGAPTHTLIAWICRACDFESWNKVSTKAAKYELNCKSCGAKFVVKVTFE